MKEDMGDCDVSEGLSQDKIGKKGQRQRESARGKKIFVGIQHKLLLCHACSPCEKIAFPSKFCLHSDVDLRNLEME